MPGGRHAVGRGQPGRTRTRRGQDRDKDSRLPPLHGSYAQVHIRNTAVARVPALLGKRRGAYSRDNHAAEQRYPKACFPSFHRHLHPAKPGPRAELTQKPCQRARMERPINPLIYLNLSS